MTVELDTPIKEKYQTEVDIGTINRVVQIYIDKWRYAGTDKPPSKQALQLTITVTSDGK